MGNAAFPKCSLEYRPTYTGQGMPQHIGSPYFICPSTGPTTVGRKNWTICVDGECDSCLTNPDLCTFSKNFPIFLSETNALENGKTLPDLSSGPSFICAKQSEANQAYAQSGELCVNITEDVRGTKFAAR